MPDYIQSSHSSFIVKTNSLNIGSENKALDSSDDANPACEQAPEHSKTHPTDNKQPKTTERPCSLPSRAGEASNTGAVNAPKIRNRGVSTVKTGHSPPLTSPQFQGFTNIPEGLRFLLLFPTEYLFLLFADPDAIISKRSPQKYEENEPGCTSAWCRCMQQVTDWVQYDPIDAPLISRQRYLKINALMTSGVQNMLTSHCPGSIRKGPVLYHSTDHTHKGVIQALKYKQLLESRYKFCRGTRNATIVVISKSKQETIPDNALLWLDSHKNQHLNPTCLGKKIITFRPLSPNDSGTKNPDSDDVIFKYQLLILLEKEILIPLNKMLKSLQRRKMSKSAQLAELLKITAKYWPRLEQIHPTIDGTCRTNYMLMQYIFMKFGFPPPVLMNPNSMDLVHTTLCEKIIGIGLKNALTLMVKKHQALEVEPIINQYTKHYLRSPSCLFQSPRDYEKYLMPETLNFSDEYKTQMQSLTKELIKTLEPLRDTEPFYTTPLMTPLQARKSS